MSDHKTEDATLASFVLTAKLLEMLMETKVLTDAQGKTAIANAMNALNAAGTSQATGAAKYLESYYPLTR